MPVSNCLLLRNNLCLPSLIKGWNPFLRFPDIKVMHFCLNYFLLFFLYTKVGIIYSSDTSNMKNKSRTPPTISSTRPTHSTSLITCLLQRFQVDLTIVVLAGNGNANGSRNCYYVIVARLNGRGGGGVGGGGGVSVQLS